MFSKSRVGHVKMQIKRFVLFRILPDIFFLKIVFRKKKGRSLDLKTSRRWTDKIQWLKLYDRAEQNTIFADKLKVRAVVQEKIDPEYLVPLFLATSKVEEIRKENLPDYPFVIKTDHDSEGVILVRDKSKENYLEIQAALRKRLRKNHYRGTKEWQYKNIESSVLVESMLIDEDGHVPDDYKVHCFHGKPEFIQVNIDRFGTSRCSKEQSFPISFCNRNWEKIKIKWGSNVIGSNIRRPELLAKLLIAAQRLAESVVYARIDFFIVRGKLFFGEITLHPTSGWLKLDSETDLHWGNLLQRTRKK
jgi:hypothetical protein